jgi:hypothetical protein
VEIIGEGDIVEIAEGLFKEKKAQVISMPKEGTKEEVTLRLVGDGETSNITVKIHADYLKLIEKQKKAIMEYVLQEGDTPMEKSSSEIPSDTTKEVSHEEPTRVMVAEEITQSTDDTFSFSEEEEEEEEEQVSNEQESGDEEEDYDDEEEEDDWAKFML